MNYYLSEMLIETVELFMLVLVRMTGMFVVSPIFGRRNLPLYYKIGFAFFLALLVTSSNTISLPETGGTTIEYAIIVAKELIIGMMIGFIPYLMFSCIYLAGQIIDMKIGFGMVNVLDPESNTQIPVTANFYFMLCMIIFITLNAHHSIVKTIFISYEIIPAGHINIDGSVVTGYIRLFSDIFITGIRLAAPIIFTLMLADIAMGIIAKAMPQMNIFIVGMPLKILVGLLIIIVTLPVVFLILRELFGEIEGETINFMRGIGAS
ncbi:MAG: flagellar type III secretion system protein FliR [Oscillospiraceae bacterium]|nr:flagellar type III secretion system protein FliR [Oscillospiraceae bacterium]